MTLPPEDRPIRVLWLIKGLGPGGAEQLLVSSARVADHRRFHYEVAYLRADKTQLVPALAESGVAARRLRGRLLWPLALRKLMTEFDVVHAHSPMPAGVARLLARTLPPERRPILVSTEHNVWDNFAKPTRWLNALTARRDARRWAVSGEVLRSMWPKLRSGASVLVHGIVLGQDAPGPGTRERVRGKLAIPEDAVVSLTVANLRKEKDYPNLLEAARITLAEERETSVSKPSGSASKPPTPTAEPEASAEERGTSVSKPSGSASKPSGTLWFLAVGQGQLAEEISGLHAQLGLGERFKLLGYRRDVPDLLAASDIFTLSSTSEGLPVSIMEAMHAGLPVVATAVGGVPEAVEDGVTGFVVPPRDSAKLAEALTNLAKDEELRAQMGDAGRERSARFDIRTAVTVQQEAYAELVERRR